jgi:UDPglucose--hexose-1-phosphate uridylyltransferase
VARIEFHKKEVQTWFLDPQEGIERVRKKRPRLKYCSINWNYLPQAGGGIFHPDLQVVLEDSSTTSHQKVLDGLRRYQTEESSFFWEDYLSEEMCEELKPFFL